MVTRHPVGPVRLTGRAHWVMATALALLPVTAARASDVCKILPAATPRPGSQTTMSPRDLVGLRDFGAPLRGQGEQQLSLSPDGRRVAFMMMRADPVTNRRCTALLVLDLEDGGTIQLLDAGGPPIDEPIELRGLRTGYGWDALNLPLWSPDGQSIAFLRLVAGLPQIWVAELAAGGAHQATNDMSGVEQFAWLPDGTSLVFANRPGLAEAEAAIDVEGRGGYLFDERIVPYMGSRPLVRLPVDTAYHVITLDQGRVRDATSAERQRLSPADRPDQPDALRWARDPSGSLALTRPSDDRPILAPIMLVASDHRGAMVECAHPACSAGSQGHMILGLWWRPGGRELVYLRQEGWADSQTALYRWTPGQVPRRVMVTDDWLGSCQLRGETLICLRDSALAPRRLVAIDLNGGTSRTLFDPNPELSRMRQGRVERLYWTNEIGLEAYGDLLLPAGEPGAQRYPLIIVQYDRRGFLRGGTGDEFPIQPFAARGFAVLSLASPKPFHARDPQARYSTIEEAERVNQRDWAQRRSINSALMTGLALALARPDIDGSRVGLTGLSDGAVAAQFALADRPELFAAASVSACCSEPYTTMIFGGLALEKERRALGFPPARGPGLAAWQHASIAMNADRIRTPLLMQLADHSFSRGLEGFMALRAAGRPVELFVFPDEFHLKVQPAHRLAIYERNIDWFDFWMCGREDADPSKQAQYLRWREMRAIAAAVAPDRPTACPYPSAAPTSPRRPAP